MIDAARSALDYAAFALELAGVAAVGRAAWTHSRAAATLAREERGEGAVGL